MQTNAIKTFLRTGEYEPSYPAWPGSGLDRIRAGERDLKSALVQEIQRRSGRNTSPALPGFDSNQFTRRKVEPMVRGFFPSAEQEPVLIALQNSIVFLTAENIEAVILQSTWMHTAWTLTNLYLGSLGADLLGPDASPIVGLSEETTCYLSTSYFHEKDPYADFLVHEAAHLFHNCRRATIGLPETERKPWPLHINFRKREEFAYACEYYSRILTLSLGSKKERLRLFAEFREVVEIPDERVDANEVISILDEAVNARNGWKRILARCSGSSQKGRGNHGHQSKGNPCQIIHSFP